jgi:hypothetical protein
MRSCTHCIQEPCVCPWYWRGYLVQRSGSGDSWEIFLQRSLVETSVSREEGIAWVRKQIEEAL